MSFLQTLWFDRMLPKLTAAQLNRMEQGIADAHTGIAVPVVTVLPSSPVDGQEICFLADAGLGVVWRFKYRAASLSAYKWESIGGGSMSSVTLANATRTNLPVVAYDSVDANDPKLTPPLSGDYVVRHGCFLSTACTVPGVLSIGVKNGTSEPIRNVTAIDGYYAAASLPVPLSQELVGTLSAGVVIAQRYYQNQQVANVTRGSAWMTATPVRVG